MRWLSIILFLFISVGVHAADGPMTLRQQFFADSKKAKLIDGAGQDCCGVADAVRVKLWEQKGSHVPAEVIDPMRHPTAKRGDIIVVPVKRLARWPLAPSELGNILFINKYKQPYCLMRQEGF